MKIGDKLETYYENNLDKPKDISNVNFDLLAVASMNEYVLASTDKPILGTTALASCTGIIIYDKNGNYSLGHLSTNYKNVIEGMVNNIDKNSKIKVIIIPGFYTTPRKIYEIKEFLKLDYAEHDFEIEIKILNEYINKEFTSIEFAFDTRTEEFIMPNYNEYFKKRG